MSFNSHRRNFSLVTSQGNKSNYRHRSLHKINPVTNPHNWLLISAKHHYFGDNNMMAAAKEFQMYLAHNPSHMQSLYLCAIAYMHMQKHSKAIQKLIQYSTLRKTSRKMIINTHLPSISNILLLLGIAYLKTNNIQQALDSVNQVISSDHKFAEGYCFRAKIYRKVGAHQKAYNDYVHALKQDQKCLAAIMGLGDYYCNNTANYVQAIKYYQKSIDILNAQNKLKQYIQDTNSIFVEVEKKDNKKIGQSASKNMESNPNLDNSWKLMNENRQDLMQELKLKYSICLYQLEKYHEAIDNFTKLFNHKNFKKGSEVYYYLGMSQLSIYQQSAHKEIIEIPKQANIQNYLREAILNLEYSIKMKSNKKIMRKAAKNLVKIHIENYQFYEACNVIEMTGNVGIEIREQEQFCEVCMQVIKHKYEQSAIRLKKLYGEIDSKKQMGKLNVSKTQKMNDQQETSSQRMQKRGTTHAICHKQKRNPTNFLGESNSPKNDWTNRNPPYKHSLLYSTNQISQSYALPLPDSRSEFQWMKPFVLLFLSYAQFFSDSFIDCLESFELYENFIKDYLGKDPDQDIYLAYNKTLCEGMLMLDNDMIEESIQKFSTCLDNYYGFMNNVAIEPILFKILALLRLSQSENPYLNQQIDDKKKLLIYILQVFDHYRPMLKNSYLSQYYQGLVFLLTQQYSEASQILQICLKNAQECLWKFLYVKGIVQLFNQNFKDAVKQFSAGLLLEQRPQLYLGRCVSYILFFENSTQKNSVLIQKSFEDLQKFIQLEDDKQKISIWVTKILFYNKAYEEANKSIQKISENQKESDGDLISIQKTLNIFDGAFEEGGILGRIIMNAFEGKYQANNLQINDVKHQIIQSDFISQDYRKWLQILNLYTQQKYQQLVKLLQRQIFDAKDNQTELMELKYDLFVVYMLLGEATKAKNVIVSLQKHEQLASRVCRIVNNKIQMDQCLDDLRVQFKSSKRLSGFLSYRKASLNSQFSKQTGKGMTLFLKISLPFPNFAKPNILFTVDKNFILRETSQSCIPKKIEAPWIKKITGMIQFTDVIVESTQNSVMIDFEGDLLASQGYSHEQAQAI